MRKFFRKFLIYLLAIGMLCPAWLATGVMKATKVKAALKDPLMTEFYVKGTNGWIEFYNPNKEVGDVINLAGYKIVSQGTSTYTCTIKPGISIDPASVKVITGSDVTCSPTNSFVLYDTNGSITFERPDATLVQPTVTYQAQLNYSNRSYSIKNSDGSWVVTSPMTEGVFEETVPAISTTQIPVEDISSGDYTITAIFSDSLTKTYQLDSGVETDYADPIQVSDEGSHILILTAKDFLNNIVTEEINFTIDKTAPVVTVDQLSTNQKTPEITGTIDDPMAVISINVNGVDYPAVSEDGTWTATITDEMADGIYEVLATATDLASNEGQDDSSNELTINTVAPAVPVVSALVTGKTIKLTWNSIEGAVKYHVYLKNKTNGAIVLEDVAVTVDAPVVEYQNNVASYGEYYAVVTAEDIFGNISAIPTVSNQTVVKVTAPAPVPATVVTTTTPVTAPETPAVTVGPTKVQAADPVEEKKVETPADDSNGQIKGDDSKDEEDDKTNWTPWIVLFVLIILAGAATGGYFYWFNGEEEVKTVVRETKKEEVKRSDNSKTAKKSNNQKKQKRW